MKQKNQFITEISEEDFRKLDLKGFRNVRKYDEHKNAYHFEWESVSLNDVLDQNIKFLLMGGWESDLEKLNCPVTVAIHVCNGPDPDDYYLDKFMNRFSGARTYQFGLGIKHLYSTRDYFEDKEDYWRVLKRETKAIYRIHLDKMYAERFKLKHKVVTEPWPYSEKEVKPGAELQIRLDLDEKSGQWIETSLVKVVYNGNSKSYTPVDKNGNEIKPETVNK